MMGMGKIPFDEKVWQLLRKIPKGKVTTYKILAKAAGNSRAARAVGNACNRNPFSPKVPCHRVVKSSGFIGGYAHGTAKKIKLLKAEGIPIKGQKIQDFKEFLFKF